MHGQVWRSTLRAAQQLGKRRFISSQTISRNQPLKYAGIGFGFGTAISALYLTNPISLDSKTSDDLILEVELSPELHQEAKLEPEPTSEGESKPEAEGEPAGEGQQAAYDPVTGEINWDCPCLGGMAHGPCGEEFKEAFSCFVYSELEPKGIDCIEKFKNMQNCFRKYPEVYSEELRDDDIEDSNDDKVEIITDEVTVEKLDDDTVAVNEKISIDLKDVDEFVKGEPQHP